MEKQKCPEIRFKGFSGEWEVRKLSEIATMYARIGWQNLRTSEFLDRGDYMLVTGTDFDDGKINYSTCHYVEKERYEQDRYIQIRNGSILITKDGTIGKVAYVQGLSMPATLNAGVFNVEIKDSSAVNELYLFQYLKAPYLMDYVGKRVTGGTIKHLNQNILVDFPVVMPTQAEQIQIGNFFQNLDQSIALHEKKFSQTQNLKKAMLEKMFPKAGSTQPEIRLKGFSGDWEVTELGNIVEFSKGKGISKQDILKTGSTSCIRYGELYTTYGSIIEKVISKTNCDKKDYILSKANQVLIPASGETQIDIATASCILESGVIIGGDLNILTTKEDGVFLSIYLSFIKKYEIAQLAQGNSVVHLYATQLQNLSIHYPCLAEQKVISQFFKQLDETLALQQQQLQTLKNLKQAFLEKMFV